jgi:hypothetical protein
VTTLPLRPWRALLLLIGLHLPLWVAAESVWLPAAELRFRDEAAVVTFGGRQAVYVSGLGWLDPFDGPPPRFEGDRVMVPPSVAAGLRGASLPPAKGVIAGIRSAGLQEVRLVLDLEGVPVEDLRLLAAVGSVTAGERLQLMVPASLGTPSPPPSVGLFDLSWSTSTAGTLLTVRGGAFAYDLFALAEPTRLVIDLRPDLGAVGFAEQVQAVAPGVVYRTFRAAGSHGPSRVHVLEVAPGAGVWSVRAVPGERRPTLAWAELGLVAINGGYFDTRSSAAIGLLVVDGEWLSPPSRGRAAVAFGPQGVVIDRVQSRTAVSADERTLVSLSDPLAARIAVHRLDGVAVGSSAEGVLVLDEAGVLLANRVGPAEVPPAGTVVAYPPELRVLALLEPGVSVRTATSLSPPALEGADFAVEAGPLLVRNGSADFAPELEGFARGVRILDEVTQQAAIGVRADGSVLLVAAEAMVAGDLVAVMLALGAQDAMRLDSGGSTTLVAEGRVLNRTSERSVVNAIVWRPFGGP